VPTKDKLINAANKQTFHTIGTGNLHITVPNRDSVTSMMLKKMLYTPDIAAMLVSIRCINNVVYYNPLALGRYPTHIIITHPL